MLGSSQESQGSYVLVQKFTTAVDHIFENMFPPSTRSVFRGRFWATPTVSSKPRLAAGVGSNLAARAARARRVGALVRTSGMLGDR